MPYPAGGWRTDAALASTTNLIQLANLAGQPRMRAESVAEQGGLLEQMGRTGDAQGVYEANLSTNVPAAWQRQAILKIAELAAAQTNFSEAVEALEKFLPQFPNSAAADVALLTLGELYLKQAVAQVPPDTNEVVQAQAQFDRFIGIYKDSPLWARPIWTAVGAFGPTANIPASLDAFRTATDKLPVSPDLAVAHFKLGDALFAQGDFAEARDNYEAVVNEFTNFPAVNEAIGAQALYQTLRACMELKDVAGASNALARILKIYPTSNVADNSVLLVGEGLSDMQQPASARTLFEKFEQLYPTSPLRPEVELALARTYEQENNWPRCHRTFMTAGWKPTRTTDAAATGGVRPGLGEFSGRARNERVSVVYQFLAQFPKSALAPVAQWWVGDHFYRAGDFVNAEKNYQLLYLNWPASSLAYPARMMAGRAAMGRQGYTDAIGYFTQLTGDTNCPPDLNAQALFAYGSALMHGTILGHQQSAGQF